MKIIADFIAKDAKQAKDAKIVMTFRVFRLFRVSTSIPFIWRSQENRSSILLASVPDNLPAG
jgi:hypothetical protein